MTTYYDFYFVSSVRDGIQDVPHAKTDTEHCDLPPALRKPSSLLHHERNTALTASSSSGRS